MLNEIEKDALQLILNNEHVLSALKKIFNAVIEEEKPLYSAIDNNTVLGEKYRAYEFGKTLVKQGFISLEGYKVIKKLPPKENRGR